MISSEHLLKHMAWANQQILSRVADFPDEALKSFISNPEWTVGDIIQHFCSSAGNYNFRLGGPEVKRFDSVADMDTLRSMLPIVAGYDAQLIDHVSESDRVVTVHRDGTTYLWQFSTILSQAVHHATEHRAQLVQALDFRGFTGISLDDFDLWAYEEAVRESH